MSGAFDPLTRSDQAVLPGGFVVVERQQHDVHGESKHSRQKQVEDQVEEQDQTWGVEGGGCHRAGVLLHSKVHYVLSPPLPPSPLNAIFIILLGLAPPPADDLHYV